MDLTQIYGLFSTDKERPFVNMTINGVTVKFLCDSGADRSLLKDEVPGVEKGKGFIVLVAANGKTRVTPTSKPTQITDETGQSHKAQLILGSECPINLLGRDLMHKFGIALVPTDQGMKAVWVGRENVLQARGTPLKWWSLDLPENDPAQISQKLLEVAREQQQTQNKVEYQDPGSCHCTLRVKRPQDQAPSTKWEKQFASLGPQRLHLQYIYASSSGQAGALVKLPEEAAELRRPEGPTVPHVSLSKPSRDEWKSIGWFVGACQDKTMTWTPTEGGWERSQVPSNNWNWDWTTNRPGDPVYRKYLGWTVTTTPRVHLSANR